MIKIKPNFISLRIIGLRDNETGWLSIDGIDGQFEDFPKQIESMGKIFELKETDQDYYQSKCGYESTLETAFYDLNE